MDSELERTLRTGLIKLMPGRRKALVYFFINNLDNVPALIADLQNIAGTNEMLKDYSVESVNIPPDFLPKGAPHPFYTDFVDCINSVSPENKILVVQNMEDYFLRMGIEYLKNENLNPETDKAKIKQIMCGITLSGYREVIHESLKQPIGLILTNEDGLVDRASQLDSFSWKSGACYLEDYY